MRYRHVSTSYLIKIRRPSSRSVHVFSNLHRRLHHFPQSQPLIPIQNPSSIFHMFSKPTPHHHHQLPKPSTMAAAALQQTPTTFQNRSPPSSQLNSKPTTRVALTSTLKTPKLTIKPLRRRISRRGGARMSDSAAGSYASALADVAKNSNTLEKTFAEVEKIEKFFSEESVLGFFTNPTIGEQDKHGIVDEIAKSSALLPHVANFLNILVDMKRIDLVKEIAKEFEALYNNLTETELAVVTSVVRLNSQHLAQIAKGVQKLTGARNVRIKTAIDPGLVAGFTIRYGNSGSKLIDMSVKKQLEEIAAQLDIGDIQLAV